MSYDIHTRRVKDEMSKTVITVTANDSVREALALMMDYHVTVLPVVDGKNRCIGIFSTTDLVAPASKQEDMLLESDCPAVDDARQWSARALTEQRLGQRRVGQLMTTAVTAVDRETPLIRAASEMLRHRVHHLPVVDEQQQLLGIVSTMDLLAAYSRAAVARA